MPSGGGHASAEDAAAGGENGGECGAASTEWGRGGRASPAPTPCAPPAVASESGEKCDSGRRFPSDKGDPKSVEADLTRRDDSDPDPAVAPPRPSWEGSRPRLRVRMPTGGTAGGVVAGIGDSSSSTKGDALEVGLGLEDTPNTPATGGENEEPTAAAADAGGEPKFEKGSATTGCARVWPALPRLPRLSGRTDIAVAVAFVAAEVGRGASDAAEDVDETDETDEAEGGEGSPKPRACACACACAEGEDAKDMWARRNDAGASSSTAGRAGSAKWKREPALCGLWLGLPLPAVGLSEGLDTPAVRSYKKDCAAGLR